MKTILDKINKGYEVEANKMELAKHEIELANINDLKKLTNDAQKDLDNWKKHHNELKSIAKLVTDSGDKFREKISKINSIGETLKKQFAELGLNYLDNQDVIKAVALLKNDFEVRSISDQARQIK